MLAGKYGVQGRLIALENAATELQRDNKELRTAVTSFRSELNLLKMAFETSNGKSAEYIEFLRVKVAARIASGNK
jgi:hypothetical protein